MADDTRTLRIGPLFSKSEYLGAEADKIIDENDNEAADEAVWMKNYTKLAEAFSKADSDFLAEYDRRKVAV